MLPLLVAVVVFLDVGRGVNGFGSVDVSITKKCSLMHQSQQQCQRSHINAIVQQGQRHVTLSQSHLHHSIASPIRMRMSNSPKSDDFLGDDYDDEFDDVDGLGSITGNSGPVPSDDIDTDMTSQGSGNGNASFSMEKKEPESLPVPVIKRAATSGTPKRPLVIKEQEDLSGCTFRKFTLGEDLTLTNFVGSLGFEEVTDWNYYETTYDNDSKVEVERRQVEPSPLDPNQPKRTRNKSGSLIRVFVGQLTGPTAATLRSQGLDSRLLIKEFQTSDDNEGMKNLAQRELASMSKLQSELIRQHGTDDAKDGRWVAQALDRNMNTFDRNSDNQNLAQLVELLAKQQAPYVSVLGELYFEDLEDIDRNDWYNVLGVSGPKPGSKWIVYEYCGLQSLQNYALPAALRLARMPAPRRQTGMFSFMAPAPQRSIPSFSDRTNYVVNGILYQCLEAVAEMHEAGVLHGSIGLGSILLSSTSMDKTEAAQLSATSVARLRVVFSDFGFGRSIADQTSDENFVYRARGFGLTRPNTLTATGFAIAEDIHALGFVFLGTLLTTLVEFPSDAPNMQMPPTGEDQLQRVSFNWGNNSLLSPHCFTKSDQDSYVLSLRCYSDVSPSLACHDVFI
jgi:serine/threonine protein kinase